MSLTTKEHKAIRLSNQHAHKRARNRADFAFLSSVITGYHAKHNKLSKGKNTLSGIPDVVVNEMQLREALK